MRSITDLSTLRQTLPSLPRLSIALWQNITEDILLRPWDHLRVLSIKRWIPVKPCLIPDCGTYSRPFYAPEVVGLEGREVELIKVLGYEDTFYLGSSQDFWRWYIPRVTWRTEVEVTEENGTRNWPWSLKELERLESEFGVKLSKVDAVVGHIDPSVELDEEWRDLDAALRCTEAVLQRFDYAQTQLVIDIKPPLGTCEAHTLVWDRGGFLAWFWLESCHLQLQKKRVSVCLQAWEYVNHFSRTECYRDHNCIETKWQIHLREISSFWRDEWGDRWHHLQSCCNGMTAPDEIEPWRKYGFDDRVEWKDDHQWEAMVRWHHFFT